MYYCMDCASGASPGRLERIAAEAARPGSLVGDALNAPFPEVCDAWPVADLGEGFRSPITSDVPVLFVSGTLDGHTPPANVEDLLPGFTHASHVVVDNASHQYLELSPPAVKQLMVRFLRGEAIDSQVITAAPLVSATQ
jgi:pimeloyl-ACP methyl ester carboxylesterase